MLIFIELFYKLLASLEVFCNLKKLMFRALLINSENDEPRISEISEDILRQDGVLVKVEYSTLNYKDCLAILHGKPILENTRWLPELIFVGLFLTIPPQVLK